MFSGSNQTVIMGPCTFCGMGLEKTMFALLLAVEIKQ